MVKLHWKRNLINKFVRITHPLFLTKASSISNIYCSLFPFNDKRHYFPRKMKPCNFEVISIAFNRPAYIKQQIILSKKYFPANMQLVIADNSSRLKTRRGILQLCKKYNVKYLAVPFYWPRLFYYSLSHGLALNWIYRNYVAKSKHLKYFGFIDHDVFPLQKARNITRILNRQKMYGCIIKNYKYWFLWPGLCFFSTDYLQNKFIDFQVKVFPFNRDNHIVLDTGSGNWGKLYNPSTLKRTTNKIIYRYIALNTKPHTNLELFGNYEWVHFGNSESDLSFKQKMRFLLNVSFPKLKQLTEHQPALNKPSRIGLIPHKYNKKPYLPKKSVWIDYYETGEHS